MWISNVGQQVRNLRQWVINMKFGYALTTNHLLAFASVVGQQDTTTAHGI